jgi:cytochrome P450
VIQELLGIPIEDRDMVREWNQIIGFGLAPLATEAQRFQLDAAEAEQIRYLKQLVEERRRQPRMI